MTVRSSGVASGQAPPPPTGQPFALSSVCFPPPQPTLASAVSAKIHAFRICSVPGQKFVLRRTDSGLRLGPRTKVPAVAENLFFPSFFAGRATGEKLTDSSSWMVQPSSISHSPWRLCADQRGSVTVEYAVLLATIAIGCALAIAGLGVPLFRL